MGTQRISMKGAAGLVMGLVVSLANLPAYAGDEKEPPAVVFVEPETRSLNVLAFVTLDRVADWLKEGGRHFVVVGPAPSWIGAKDYDRALHVRSVALVRNLLVDKGAAPQQITMVKSAIAPEPRPWLERRRVVLVRPRDFDWPPVEDRQPSELQQAIEADRSLQERGLAPPSDPGMALELEDVEVAASE